MFLHGEFYHNSHLELYRSPFGAAPCGEEITLRLSAPISYYGDCTLRLWIDDGELLLPMVRYYPEDDRYHCKRIFFEAKFPAPKKPCLIWYYFFMSDSNSFEYYGNNALSSGGEGDNCSHAPAAYQITVFNPTETPSWWKDGVMYQIFPDRFCNGNEDGKINSPKRDSLLYSDWYDNQSYHKDVNGDILSWTFAGGNFKGIASKLPYLKNMGVSIVYLNPIFEARSSHRYDTADFKKLDPVLGTDEDFDMMIAKGKQLGINFILDGVFSHTGADSIYFNKYKNYGDSGAYNSPESEYFSWFRFNSYPEKYSCWWDFPELPNVNKGDANYCRFMCTDDNSVIRHWLRRGIMGFRLDVADELPDAFIRLIRETIKEENKDAILIGEVWEDASNKQSYDVLRGYFYGDELDGVMNYPFRAAMMNFALSSWSSAEAMAHIMSIVENYPPENLHGSMVPLSTHDRPRAISVLGGACSTQGELFDTMTEGQKRNFKLPDEAYSLAVSRFKMLTSLQMALPGTPSIYYGDEIGMQGFMDPYNRATYKWNRGDNSLSDWIRDACILRREVLSRFAKGRYLPLSTEASCLGFSIDLGEETLYVYANRDPYNPCDVQFSSKIEGVRCLELISGTMLSPVSKKHSKTVFEAKIPAVSTRIFLVTSDKNKTTLTRSMGVLMHPTSLPSEFCTGDLGENAYKFVDFLAEAKQSVWQILPLCPAGGGDSPYQTISCFAGSPLLIDPHALIKDGLLLKAEVAASAAALANFSHELALFDQARAAKEKLFRSAFSRFKRGGVERFSASSSEYIEFLSKNSGWLPDFALFSVLREQNNSLPWYSWENTALSQRRPSALENARAEFSDEIQYHSFLQFLFYSQYQALRSYATERGIKLLGDVPIYVAADSADVWSNQQLFKLKSDGSPAKVSGCPPDYFTEDGQLWGNPVFTWEAHRSDKFEWWKRRLRHSFQNHDLVRLDHFRGFEAYWEVDSSEKTARYGHWEKGVGAEFFEEMLLNFGNLPVVAEDLGHITAPVHNLKNLFSFPGMEVYQFSDLLKYGSDFSTLSNSVLYTGTHDNATLAELFEEEHDSFTADELGEYILSIVKKLCLTPAPLVIVPIQDILRINRRMNVPGTMGGINWRFRLTPTEWQNMHSKSTIELLRALALESGR